MNKFKRGLVAAISAGLVITGGAAMGPAMVAAQSFQETVKTLPSQDTANLTIHKYPSPSSALPNDGRKLSEAELDGMDGLDDAIFRVTKVDDIDLKTNAGWRAAAKLDVEAAKNQLDTGVQREVRTTGGGIAKFDGLPVGLYLVEEIQAPAGYKAADDFLVTLPLTNPQDRSEWLYDVHVYPKNTEVPKGEPSKTVEDANKNAGDRIKYSITAPIADYENVTWVRVDDKYSTGRLTSPQVANVKVSNDASSVELGTDDYNVNGDTDGTHVLQLTEAGLKKVNDLGNATKRTLSYELSFEVLPVEGDSAGLLKSVDNTLELRQSNHTDHKPTTPPGDTPPLTPPPGTPPPTTPPGDDPLTRTYFGNVQLKKVSSEDSTVPVDGAKFDIYRCNNVDEIKAAIANNSQGAPVKSAVTENGGVATFLGLHANNFVDNETKSSDPSGYCLVESQAVQGYELLAEPVYFTVNADLTNHTVARTEIATDDTSNVPTFGLPLTGGAGVWMILGAGLLLLITASGYFVFRQRQA
ncbi:SpaH/EbpB family LPXTG-anchored major pilin [Corynebacterium cystitidis]|uniref:SpaH/EbpB family LPXTG-anchored major pilin n=1 Tax=Corynebacterium cystitidis TaxID=35757 RepID=UPI00211E13CA|nr:SpaH/EbpB family LPXTG-anchored major pilin [Corynebacterium cystitidis]